MHPWCGPHWGRLSKFGISLLILGESHYSDHRITPESDQTEQVVSEWRNGDWNARFFTMIAKVLLRQPDGIDRDRNAEVWGHVAFYNYIQSFVPFGEPPTDHQWKEARAPFETVLRCLKPDAILICGRRLSANVLHRPQNVAFETITHPRGGLAYCDAIPAFKELLARCQAPRQGVKLFE